MAHKKLIKIALVGPESTGKSTLTLQLAAHYQCGYVLEYAREYMAALNRPYMLEDITRIANGQMEQEMKASEAGGLVICDTNLLVCKIWAENAFQHCPDAIHEKWNAKDYQLHLLMQIDLPWEYDPQREHPTKRQYFFDWYERELIEANANYRIIAGNAQERFKNAVQVIDSFLNDFVGA